MAWNNPQFQEGVIGLKFDIISIHWLARVVALTTYLQSRTLWTILRGNVGLNNHVMRNSKEYRTRCCRLHDLLAQFSGWLYFLPNVIFNRWEDCYVETNDSNWLPVIREPELHGICVYTVLWSTSLYGLPRHWATNYWCIELRLTRLQRAQLL